MLVNICLLVNNANMYMKQVEKTKARAKYKIKQQKKTSYDAYLYALQRKLRTCTVRVENKTYVRTKQHKKRKRAKNGNNKHSISTQYSHVTHVHIIETIFRVGKNKHFGEKMNGEKNLVFYVQVADWCNIIQMHESNAFFPRCTNSYLSMDSITNRHLAEQHSLFMTLCQYRCEYAIYWNFGTYSIYRLNSK